MPGSATGQELAHAYLDAFVARDYDRVRSLLADDFRLRDLSPGGFTQLVGADEAMEGVREFLDMFEFLDVLEADVYEIADVTYLRARVHFVHAEAGERFLEQHHLLRVAAGLITGIDQLCTGLHMPRGTPRGEAEASPRRRCQPATPVPIGQATPVPPIPQ